jgi:hypothetical protein
MSKEAFRREAILAALHGILASEGSNNPPGVVDQAVHIADLLVERLERGKGSS